MPVTRSLYLPPQYAISQRTPIGALLQLLRPSFSGEAQVEPTQRRLAQGESVRLDGRRIVVLPRRRAVADGEELLVLPSGCAPADRQSCRALGRKVRWVTPSPTRHTDDDLDWWQERTEAVRQSWEGRFAFREGRTGADPADGLRSAQLGALYAALGHWKAGDQLATVVMPTGSGKTETMLALLAKERFPRLLVIVPTSALREQIGMKFVDLGLLKELGVLQTDALYPIVGFLDHRPRSVDDTRQFFRHCNVVVTTMAIAGACIDTIQATMAQECSHLFIDEAHHIAAPTWERFRRSFRELPVLQFTATPFRSDRKHVDGKVIFNYPLRKAQQEGYFRPINFVAVMELDTEAADAEIAAAAIRQLEHDRAAGFRHTVMARGATIDRATYLHQLYRRLVPAQHPLLVHSEMPTAQRRDALRRLREGETGVVVCVDMLGEGFDLPELKIAALHDAHRSLAITLQFAGRFTRTRHDIGDATMIANVANPSVDEALRELYAEDADWNIVLRRLSEGETGRQARRADFFEAFSDPPTEIPLQNVFPKMSTVVYRTTCEQWNPNGIRPLLENARVYAGPTVNHRDYVMLFVLQVLDPISWGEIRDLQDSEWVLFLIHWDPSRQLLFINSSNNEGTFEEIAQAICGEAASLVRGERVFRALHGLNRLMFMNLGLSHSLNRMVRFTMYAGPDVYEGLSEAHLQNKIKTNLFARGFRDGERASVGASQRGRIWSHQVANDIPTWVDWCERIGGKLLDESIVFADVLKSALVPRVISERPDLVPLAIEWPEEFYLRGEDAIHVEIGSERVPFYDAGLELVEHRPEGPIQFRVVTENTFAEFEITIGEEGTDFVQRSVQGVEFVMPRRRGALANWFRQMPPTLLFERGALMIGNLLYTLQSEDRTPYPADRIRAWDWTGVDLRRESQGLEKATDSIQRRVITRLASEETYDVIFDDDQSNEAADVVAIRAEDPYLRVDLFHCKFSQRSQAGARVEDLYAVCGQAQRSAHWKGDPDRLFTHLIAREFSRIKRTGVTRFEHGDLKTLPTLRRRAQELTPRFTVHVVQPGLSRSAATVNQLELLAATELYLKETFAVNFGVIASE